MANSAPGGRYAIVASNAGSAADPGWCRNLRVRPRITVEVGARAFTVLAEELPDTPLD